jgi:hypothetical protein
MIDSKQFSSKSTVIGAKKENSNLNIPFLQEIKNFNVNFYLSKMIGIKFKKNWKKWSQNPYFNLLFVQCDV